MATDDKKKNENCEITDEKLEDVAGGVGADDYKQSLGGRDGVRDKGGNDGS